MLSLYHHFIIFQFLLTRIDDNVNYSEDGIALLFIPEAQQQIVHMCVGYPLVLLSIFAEKFAVE